LSTARVPASTGRIARLLVLIWLLVLLVPACETGTAQSAPSGIQLQDGSVAPGTPFTLRVTGTGLNAESRATLTRDFGNRAQLVSRLPLWGSALDIQLQGDFAYVANNTKGLVILDVSNPAKVEITASLELPGRTLRTLPHGNLLVTANVRAGIQLVDISDPVAPSHMASIATPGQVLALDMADDLLFAAADSEGLIVIDISQRDNPVMIARLAIPGRSLAVNKVGRHVYLAGTEVLAVVDVSSPEQPVLLDTLALDGNAFQMVHEKQRLYLAQGFRGVQVVDVRQPEHPVVVGQVENVGHVVQLAIEAGRAYLASTPGMFVLDLDTRPLPTALGGVAGVSRVSGVAVRHGMVFMAENTFGLEVFDLRQPRTLGFSRQPPDGLKGVVYNSRDGEIGQVRKNELPSTGGRPDFANISLSRHNNSDYFMTDGLSVAENGSMTYVGTPEGIQILGDTRAGQTRLIGHTADGQQINDLTLMDDYLYAAGGSRGLLVYRLDSAGTPVLTTVLPLPGAATAVAAEAGLVYLAQQKGGLVTVDVSDPQAPRQVSSLQLPYPIKELSLSSDIALRDGHVYVADGTNGLLVVDVTDPRSPEISALIRTGDLARHIFLKEHILSLADSRAGVRLYDISVPDQPVLVGRLGMSLTAVSSIISGNYLGIATKSSEIVWLDIPVEAIGRRLLGEGEVEFSFPAGTSAGYYTLRVFNSLGGEDLIGAVTIGAAGERP